MGGVRRPPDLTLGGFDGQLLPSKWHGDRLPVLGNVLIELQEEAELDILKVLIKDQCWGNNVGDDTV